MPRVFYLRDKNGELVPVPGMTLEDFRRLWDLDQKVSHPQPQPPPYVLTDLLIDGEIDGETARLGLRIQVSMQRDGWVKVPLRLNDAILYSSVKHEGDGEVVLEFQRGGEGLICWLEGERGSLHTLSFDVACRLQQVEAETRFSLTVPSAMTSAMQLKLPDDTGMASYLDSSGDYVRLNVSDGQVTRQGLEGTVQVAWSKDSTPMTPPPVVMEATGEIVVTVLRGGGLRADARISVRSWGGAVKSMEVVFPPGMRWVPQNTVGYTVEPLEAAEDGQPIQNVKVTIQQPSNGPFDIRLRAMSDPRDSAASEWQETGGFQVQGATREAGFVNVRVEDELVLNWRNGANVFRVDPSRNLDEQPDIVARFEYVSQPYSLRLQAMPKRTRIDVDPVYLVDVSTGDTQLVATLNYRIRGLEAEQLRVEMGGWIVDRVLPAELVDVEALNLNETSPLVIPLSTQARTASELRLTVQAHRMRAPGEEELDLLFPKPEADVASPATIVISPADNVEISPIASRTQGLLEETLPPQLDIKPRQQPPLYFRERGDVQQARLVAGRRDRQQQIFASLTNRLVIDQQKVQVEQEMLYRIEYEPTERLILDVPRTIYESGGLKVFVDDTAVRPIPEQPSAANPIDSNDTHVPLGIELFSGQRIGAHQVTVRYTAPMPENISAERPAELVIPLAIPSAKQVVTVTSNRLETSFADALRVDLSDEKWIGLDPGPTTAGMRTASFTSDMAVRGVTLSIQMHQVERQGSTTVRQCWIQTWLTENHRRDRAVYRMLTSQKELSIRLPEGAKLITVALDGREANYQPFEEPGGERLLVSMFSPDNLSEHVVEIWTVQPRDSGLFGDVVFQSPQVPGVEHNVRFFWQVVTPDSEYLVVYPTGLTPEMRWTRRGAIWGPRANRTQQDLERWSNAIARTDIPPNATNQYLFSGYGAAERTTGHTASRVGVVFISSSIVLALVLMWIYLSPARHPLVVFAGCLAMVSAGIAFPEPLQLALRTGLLGGGLAVLALVLNRWLSPRRATVTQARDSSLITADSQTFRGPLLHQESGPRGTTTTAPAMVREPSAEIKS